MNSSDLEISKAAGRDCWWSGASEARIDATHRTAVDAINGGSRSGGGDPGGGLRLRLRVGQLERVLRQLGGEGGGGVSRVGSLGMN
jgi:hypothetical protein